MMDDADMFQLGLGGDESWTVADLKRQVVTLKQQRDHLLAALEKISDLDPDTGTSVFHDIAFAAIAKEKQP